MKHILLTALFQARVLMSINHQHVINIIKVWQPANYSTNRNKTDQAVKRGGGEALNQSVCSPSHAKMNS